MYKLTHDILSLIHIWIPRTVRQKQKRIEEAIKNIEARTGRAAADEEIAGEIGIAAAELNEWQSQLKVTNVVSLNEFVEQGGEPVMDAVSYTHLDVYKRQVYGMPKAVAEAGVVDEVVPLNDVAKSIIKNVGVK